MIVGIGGVECVGKYGVLFMNFCFFVVGFVFGSVWVYVGKGVCCFV